MTALTWNKYPTRAPDPRWADNWEDDPGRESSSISRHWKSSKCIRQMDDRRKQHHGIIGKGALLLRIIKENT